MSAAALLAPVCAHGKGDDQDLPLVVLMHGRGSNESEIVRLADHLPDGAQYVALRAPIAENGGFAWFANRGIGRPVAELHLSVENQVEVLARLTLVEQFLAFGNLHLAQRAPQSLRAVGVQR